MRIIVTHKSSDLDAIMSVWLIKRFFQAWQDAQVKFVPAGLRLEGYDDTSKEIEINGDDQVIHVDTGMGPLDHHQDESNELCGASKTYNFVVSQNDNLLSQNESKNEAVKRMVEMAIDIDHFQEVFYQDPTSYVYDFSIIEVINGFRMMFPKDDQALVEFMMKVLDSILHSFENRIWAEKEIKEKGIIFDTKWGKTLAMETLNDDTMKLGQKMGYELTVRKDPNNQGVRIKARPNKRKGIQERTKTEFGNIDVDLTPVYEILKEKDPEATWYLHISKRMLLNGSSKNPEMKGSKLTLQEVIDILKNL